MVNRVLAFISALFLMTVGVSAAPVSVDLTRNGDLAISGATGTFNVDGISGQVRAYSSATLRPRISQYRNGIGVSSGWYDDTRQLDGWFNELLNFTFDTAVRLISVSFSHVDRNDDWDIYVGRDRLADNSSQNPFYFGGVIANSFSVLADGHSCFSWYCYSEDNFVISSFTVDADVGAVPLPASALLLIGGLAGFGVMRRRKQQIA